MRTLQTDRERAAAIAAATLTDGGATFVLLPASRGVGYFLTPGVLTGPTFVVGRAADTPAREVPAQAFGANDVLHHLIVARATGADGVGTWRHDGTVYVDLVDVFTDREAALAAARDRGEMAIWDAYASEEITVTVPAA
jgi:hypothetical protein